jgi:hypothetical protein
MTDPAREPFLFVRIEADIKSAGELNRRKDVKAAIELVAMVENMAAELKHVLAHRALLK